MATLLNLIKKLTKPDAIPFARDARTPPELLAIFQNDPRVQRLLSAGRSAAPLIGRELQKNDGTMPETALMCLAWILSEAAPDVASYILGPLFARSMACPTPYFTQLAAHILRRQAGLPTNNGQMCYTSGELRQTRETLETSVREKAGAAGPLATNGNTRKIEGVLTAGDYEFESLFKTWPGGTSPDESACNADETDEWKEGNWFDKGVRRCHYIHITDRSNWEVLGPTIRYCCFCFVAFPRRAVETHHDPPHFRDDNCEYKGDSNNTAEVKPGDIVNYDLRGFYGNYATTHWARVWKVAPIGQPVRHVVTQYQFGSTPGVDGPPVVNVFEDRVLEVRGKISGTEEEAIHSPYNQAIMHKYARYVDSKLTYYRQIRPLRGNIADLWIKTHPADTGEQYCVDAFWESPDIEFSKGPFPVDDRNWVPVGDTDPAIWIGQRYRIWAKVRNRGDQPVGIQTPGGVFTECPERKAAAYIRYYWAYSGCPQRDDWNLISWPLGPFTLPARAGCDGNPEVNAPYAQWTPPAYDPATGLRYMGGHLCFLAVVYAINTNPEHRGNPAGDDPKNRCNPDPIVYPWEPAWDNNIAMRNMQIIEARAGQSTSMSLLLGTPHDMETIQGALETVVSHQFETARQGMTEDPAPLEVFLRMGGDSEVTTSIDEYKEKGILFLPNDDNGLEKHLGGVVLPYKLPGGKRTQFFDVKIRAPKRAKPGSTYYVRIAQNLDGRIVSGCTIVVRIV